MSTTPCATCARGCCSLHIVGVTGYDVRVIARELELAPERFVRVAPAPSTYGFRLDRGGPSYRLILASRPAGAAPFRDAPGSSAADAQRLREPCLFLIELPDGTGRCGIYPLRPLVCQTYPAHVIGGQVGRRDTVLCPDEAWRGGALEGPAWREGLARQAVEDDIHALAVDRWNFQVLHSPPAPARDLRDFLVYLVHVYERLELARAALAPAEWAALCLQWARCLDRGASPLLEERAELAPWAGPLAAIRAAVTAVAPLEEDQQMREQLARWEAAEHAQDAC